MASLFSPPTMDPIHDFMKNGKLGKRVVQRGVEVAFTHLGEYYIGRAVVMDIIYSRLLNLCRVVVEDICQHLHSTHIPFPKGEIQTVGQCVERTFVWETVFLMPFVEELDSQLIGRLPMVEEDVKPIMGFLSLELNMKLALVSSNGCVGIGMIEAFSTKGVWYECLIPNNFMVVVKLLSVNTRLKEHETFCKDSGRQTMQMAIGFWNL